MPELPAGTVTFLCADVDRIAQLEDTGVDHRSSAADRLRSRLAAVAADQGGTGVAGAPGGACAVFALAADALAAAVALQQALLAESGPGAPSLPRVALHTGESYPGESGYGGAALRRCRCLQDAAHGGQILLSLVTTGLVYDALPPGASLRELGTFRLPDLGRPEQVFQLVHPALPDGFPPPRTLDAWPHNLPEQLTTFVGREREMAAVRRLLGSRRLVTLTGAGGCGKTRLALQVAAAVAEVFSAGVWLVELAPVRDGDLVVPAVAAALGLREEPGRPLLEQITAHCQSGRQLVVLDNCEHLVAAAAGVTEALLRGCPNLRILATSREPLAVAGEAAWPVPALALPTTRPATLAALAQFESVRLFIDRALDASPQFAVTNENAPAVAQICHRLDGIPLAIELAAARVRSLTPEEISARLEHRFRLLTGGSRTALPRHQTLRAMVDWSHDLLTPPERSLLCRLAVFAGGFSLEAAEVVAAGDGVPVEDVVDLLSQLVDKSMLLAENRGGETRYRLLETIREYAEERLQAAGEATAVCGRHRDWCLDMAQRAGPELRVARMLGRPGEQAWHLRLTEEHDNLRAALRWSMDAGEVAGGLRLATALARFWHWRGFSSEGRRWLELCLAQSPAATPERGVALGELSELVRVLCDYPLAEALATESQSIWRQVQNGPAEAATLRRLGFLARAQGAFPRAEELFRDSAALMRAAGDQTGLLRVLVDRWSVAHRRQDQPLAQSLQQEALTLARAAGDRRLLAETLLEMGQWARVNGDYALTGPFTAEGLALARELGDRRGIAWGLQNIGNLLFIQGDLTQAQAMVEESLAIRRAMGFGLYVADSLCSLAAIVFKQGGHAEIAVLLDEALTVQREIGDNWGVARTLELVAALAAAAGDATGAARLQGASAGRWNALGCWPLTVERTVRRDAVRGQAITILGEGGYASAWEQGRALAQPEAVQEALLLLRRVIAPGQVPASAAAAPPGPEPRTRALSEPDLKSVAPHPGTSQPDRAGPTGPAAALTNREREIVLLVAQGLTDREVATRLFISPRTVDTHLRNVFAKVGVPNRAGLTAWAARSGLLQGS